MTERKLNPIGCPRLVAPGQLYRVEAEICLYPNNRTYRKVSNIFNPSSYVDYAIPAGYCVPDHNPTRQFTHIPVDEMLLTLRQFAALEWGKFSKCIVGNESFPAKEACEVYFEVLVMETVGLVPASTIAYLCKHVG